MANKKRGMLEREILETMRDWPEERRQALLLRGDELHRTLRWIERREREKPSEVFQLQPVADSLALTSTEPTAPAGEEATQELTSV